MLLKSLDDPEKHWTPDMFSRFNGWTDEMSEAHISTIWALGASGDAVRRAQAAAAVRVRRIRAYVRLSCTRSARCPAMRSFRPCRRRFKTTPPDVRWNAAVALARHGRRDGESVLKQMLDRSYVEQIVKREARPDADIDPVADVMISGLRAAAVLKDDALKPAVSTISQTDSSLKVREVALEALKIMG